MDKNFINVKMLFVTHFEWVALATGLLLMGLMNPYAEKRPSLCLLDRLGFPFCPGEGLGHSIAFMFRGDLGNALDANILGPASIIIILGRVIYLIRNKVLKQ